jgi:lycopene cyclase CruA
VTRPTSRPPSTSLADELRPRYPRTVAAFEAMGALDHLARVWRLERGWQAIAAAQPPAPIYRSAPANDASQAHPDYDLIYAGAGLGLLHAALMAQRYGYRVLVFDRGEVGCAHREWNISRAELARLVATGLLTWDELQPITMAEYRAGVVRFHAEGSSVPLHPLYLHGVLDVALDAGALLRLLRQKLLDAGATVLDGRMCHEVCVASAGALRVTVAVQRIGDGPIERYTGRLLLDGMGSTSPLALARFAGQPFAGVCPTVGTVVTGLEPGHGPQQHDPSLGDILITVDDAAHNGQQYMWEGFPGHGDELTVYLFYYDRVTARQHSLLALYEDYFALLPSYKAPGPAFRHLKPVYGYIPARHSLSAQEAPLLRGVLPVGDSAAQQSPLTFCGFGSHVRNLYRTTTLLDYALRHELLEPHQLAPISSFQANVSLNWVFSRFMKPWRKPHGVNELQNVFLAVLDDLGHDLAVRFFRDQMRWGDYHRMILGTFRRYPQIVLIAAYVLGARGVVQWIGDYLRFCVAAVRAALAQRLGPLGCHALLRLAAKQSPALGLRVASAFAHWQAMGWLAADPFEIPASAQQSSSAGISISDTTYKS